MGRLPTVSVVIPVKDDARLLDRCLDALERQWTSPLEVIVVDNSSSDASREVAAGRGAILLEQRKPGIAAASRVGYDRATGDIIARIDADTVVGAAWVGAIAQSFTARPEVDAVTGWARFIDGPRPLRRSAAVAYLGAYYLSCGLALSHVPVFGSNFAMRREAWQAVRSDVHDSTRFHDDLDLSFHLGSRHRIAIAPRLVAGISMRPFSDGAGDTRILRGFSTVAAHWPGQLPGLRLLRRFLRPVVHAAASGVGA